MELFKKIFNHNEKGFKPNDNETEKILDKQNDLGISGDISSNDLVNELNQEIKTREIIGKRGQILNERSDEEIERDDHLIERLHDLKNKYDKLREEILKKQSNLNELRYSKSGTEKAAKNLTLKQIDGGYNEIIQMTRNAEDRMKRLAKKIRSSEIDLAMQYKDLEEIEEMIKNISMLIKNPEIGDKTIEKSDYRYEQN